MWVIQCTNAFGGCDSEVDGDERKRECTGWAGDGVKRQKGREDASKEKGRVVKG